MSCLSRAASAGTDAQHAGGLHLSADAPEDDDCRVRGQPGADGSQMTQLERQIARLDHEKHSDEADDHGGPPPNRDAEATNRALRGVSLSVSMR